MTGWHDTQATRVAEEVEIEVITEARLRIEQAHAEVLSEIEHPADLESYTDSCTCWVGRAV